MRGCFLSRLRRDSPTVACPRSISWSHVRPSLPAAFQQHCWAGFLRSHLLRTCMVICFPVFLCFIATLRAFKTGEGMSADTMSWKKHQLIMKVIINSNIKPQLGPDWLKMTGRSRRPESTFQGLFSPFPRETEQLSPGRGRLAQPGPANPFHVSPRLGWAGTVLSELSVSSCISKDTTARACQSSVNSRAPYLIWRPYGNSRFL